MGLNTPTDERNLATRFAREWLVTEGITLDSWSNPDTVLVFGDVEAPLLADIRWASCSAVSWTAKGGVNHRFSNYFPYNTICGIKQKALSLPSTEQLLVKYIGTWGSNIAVIGRSFTRDASVYSSAIEGSWGPSEGGSEEGEGDEDSLDGNHFVCLGGWKRKMLGKARRLGEC